MRPLESIRGPVTDVLCTTLPCSSSGIRVVLWGDLTASGGLAPQRPRAILPLAPLCRFPRLNTPACAPWFFVPPHHSPPGLSAAWRGLRPPAISHCSPSDATRMRVVTLFASYPEMSLAAASVSRSEQTTTAGCKGVRINERPLPRTNNDFHRAASASSAAGHLYLATHCCAWRAQLPLLQRVPLHCPCFRACGPCAT